jgi:hypothetical protein
MLSVIQRSHYQLATFAAATYDTLHTPGGTHLPECLTEETAAAAQLGRVALPFCTIPSCLADGQSGTSCIVI